MPGARGQSKGALSEFVTVFDEATASYFDGSSSKSAPSSLLNGQAGAEIRRLLPLAERRRLGAFFTPHELGDELVARLRSSRGPVTVVDPCCGAGDLLLAAARAIEGPLRAGTTSANFVGVEMVDQFSRVARMRFELLLRTSDIHIAGRFAVGDGRTAPVIEEATHILLNPPYASVLSHDGCEWAQGKVNGAAEFLARILVRLQPGAEVSAILPEVLRSGTRYRRWRTFVTARLDIDTPEPKGRFDPWTDVDVFVLRGRARSLDETATRDEWVRTATGPTVGERFEISVGALVDYRSPLVGAAVPYLSAKDFPAWSTIPRIDRHRRFSGRLHSGPMVVVPRTSRPGEPHRARAALVTDLRGVAVENHLLVLRPRRGGVSECRRLLSLLRSQHVSDWLDRVIRCRHLTVGAMASIPWVDLGSPIR
jgi:hypothetical protein